MLRYLVENDIQLGIRLREGPDKGTLEWRRPNRMTLQTLLHNPAYAGIYAYGRRRVDPRRQDPARPSTGRVVRSRDGWHVMIPNVLPAYITVTQFEANEAKHGTVLIDTSDPTRPALLATVPTRGDAPVESYSSPGGVT